MPHLLDAHSYQLRLASLPFAVAVAALVVIAAWAAFTRGAPLVRWSLFAFSLALMPYVGAQMLVHATDDRQLAIGLYRIGVSAIPLSTVFATIFLLAIAERALTYAPWVLAALAVSLGVLIAGWNSPAVVDDIWTTPSGLIAFHSGWLVLWGVAAIGIWSGAGALAIWRARRSERSPSRRRQMAGAHLAMAVVWLGMIDVPLGYHLGWVPLGWAFTTLGAALALRSLAVDDVLRAQAIDRRAPLAAAYFVMAVVAGWEVAARVLPGVPWHLGAIVLVGAYTALRVALAVASLAATPSVRGPDGPLDRLAAQFASRVQALVDDDAIGTLTSETVEVALGARAQVLVPAAGDWSWTRPGGEVLAEAATPDPLLVPWLLEHRRLILREDLELLRLADLRPALERLMIGHDAAALLPLTSHDELIGLLVVSGRPTGRALRREELSWLQRAGDRLAAALVYARMARQARSQVALEREVELAAAVQAAFVPNSLPHQVGAVEIVGTWEPASQCGGDWWGYYALPGDRVLITIGDVTGHGVAAAMVTAAAKGSCDVAVRLMGGDLDLPTLMARLDAAVRRVGAGRFHLTCFAAVIDPAAGEVRFANAGHVAPYVARDVGKAELELHALVARGNPLGAGLAATARTAHRAIVPGDVLVWYTDGLIEGVDPDGQQFGDRRMQRTLRRLDRTRLDPETVHNVIAGAASDHRSGRPHDDDLTLVVARWQPAEGT